MVVSRSDDTLVSFKAFWGAHLFTLPFISFSTADKHMLKQKWLHSLCDNTKYAHKNTCVFAECSILENFHTRLTIGVSESYRDRGSSGLPRVQRELSTSLSAHDNCHTHVTTFAPGLVLILALFQATKRLTLNYRHSIRQPTKNRVGGFVADARRSVLGEFWNRLCADDVDAIKETKKF